MYLESQYYCLSSISTTIQQPVVVIYILRKAPEKVKRIGHEFNVRVAERGSVVQG